MSVVSPASPTDFVGNIPPIRNPLLSRQVEEFPILLRRYRLALALFVASFAMLFAGFSSAYVVRRGIPTYDAASGAYSAAWEPLRLPIGLLLLNSCLLISASGAIEVVRRRTKAPAYTEEEIKHGVVPLWLNASLLLGTGFLLGQGIAWHSLASNGQFLSTGARTAFFYVLTGAHGVHALLGVVFTASIAVCYARMSPTWRYLAVDLTAWYLHSITLLWIYLFCFVLFA